MSELKQTSNSCNILDIINGVSSGENSEKGSKNLKNINRNIIIPQADGGRQAQAFIIKAFTLKGLM